MRSFRYTYFIPRRERIKIKAGHIWRECSLAWVLFSIQFDCLGESLERENKNVLVSCLRGKARCWKVFKVWKIWNLRSSDRNLSYGENRSLSNYYSQFTNRKQKFDESLTCFDSDIERLAYLEWQLSLCSWHNRVCAICFRFVRRIRE